MRRFLVSSFLADVTQQIHSLRASGVISAHTSFTMGSDSIALRRSAGILCNAPLAVSSLVMLSYLSPFLLFARSHLQAHHGNTFLSYRRNDVIENDTLVLGFSIFIAQSYG